MQHGLRCLAYAILIFASAKVSAADGSFDFQIPAGAAQDTLRMFVDTTNMPMLYRQSDVEGVPTPGVSGRRTARDALIALLEGTPLEPKFKSGDRAVHIGRREPAREVAVPVLVNETQPLVVVTGSYLLDVKDLVSPLVIRMPDEIRHGPNATPQDALQLMPMVSRAGPSEVNDPGGNFGRGSSINLRGLGAGATLTLFNGHRMAPSGANADFVDVSSIPVSAIDRIEVLPDGSSALYGSDPIAGIVNIILRDDLQGAESQAKVGGSPGGASETLAAQLFGTHWRGGNAFVAYQYRERTSLPVSARSYASNADKRPQGGSDLSSFFGNPGNLLDPATGQPEYGIPRGQDGQGLTVEDLSKTLNRQNSVADTDLLPDVKTHSFYASGSQQWGRVGLSVEGRFNQRSIAQRYPAIETILAVPSGTPFFIDTGDPVNLVGYSFAKDKDFGPLFASGRTQDYGGAATVSWNVVRDWTASFTEAYHGVDLDWLGQNQVNFDALSTALALTDAKAFNPYGDGSYTDLSTLESIRENVGWHVWSSVETETLLLQGPFAHLRGGDASVAVGVELRKEELAREETEFKGPEYIGVEAARLKATRHVESAFAELSLPVWGDASNSRATPAVLMKLAGRADQYSDFGKLITPKVTLEAALTPAVKLRGTLGLSFRAPLLTDLYDTTNNRSALQVLNDPSSFSGQSLALIDQQNNPHLLAENARTWTVGFDWVPEPGFGVSLTYYGIDYWNQVFRQGSSSISLETILASPEWSQLVTRNPSPQAVEAVCQSTVFMGIAEQCATTPPAAIIHVEPRNLSSTQLRGYDLSITRSLERPAGLFDLKLDASYISKFEQELVQGSQTVRLVDKVDNPAAVRARTMFSWRRHRREGLGAAVSLDYTGPYKDNVSPTLQTIEGTFITDLDLSYRSGSGTSEWNNLELDLGFSNVFNKAPPFVDRLQGYDVANARPYGRVIGLYLTKHW